MLLAPFSQWVPHPSRFLRRVGGTQSVPTMANGLVFSTGLPRMVSTVRCPRPCLPPFAKTAKDGAPPFICHARADMN